MTDLKNILTQDSDVQAAEDFIAGSGGYVKDSDVYLMKVKHAVLGESSAGAISVQLSMIHAGKDGVEFNTTVYITSGKAKGQKAYFEKNGKKFPLPGYTIIDDMCRIASGNKLNLATAPRSTKNVEMYSADAGKKVPTQVEVIDVLTNAVLKVGLLKKLTNKWKNGKPTAETREQNDISAVFFRDDRSVREVNAKSTVATFISKWLEAHKGTTVDERTVVEATTSAHAAVGATSSADTKEVDDLFN